MVRRLVRQGALFLVAGVADLGLFALVAYGVVSGMDLVAGGAGDIAALVRATLPMPALHVGVVAAHAGLVAVLRVGATHLAEHKIRLRRLAAALVAHVRIALAVAIAAGRRAAIGNRAVLALADAQRRATLVRFVVALGAARVASQHQAIRHRCLGLGHGVLGVGQRCKACESGHDRADRKQLTDDLHGVSRFVIV